MFMPGQRVNVAGVVSQVHSRMGEADNVFVMFSGQAGGVWLTAANVRPLPSSPVEAAVLTPSEAAVLRRTRVVRPGCQGCASPTFHCLLHHPDPCEVCDALQSRARHSAGE